MNHDRPETGQEINLATILNILWRRRLVVLGLPALGLAAGLLYGIFAPRGWEATVSIRPGITAFGPDGAAQRQWRHKDIQRWYDKRAFHWELARRLGLQPGQQVRVESEYLPPGLHDYIGGDVVTLWTIAGSPELAAAILDTSLWMFGEFSEIDTVGSQLKLTRENLELQIRRQETQLERLRNEDSLLDLQIASGRADSLLIIAEDEQLHLDLTRLEKQHVYLHQRLNTLRAEEPQLQDDLTQLDQTLRRLTDTADVQRDASMDIPSWVRRDAILDSSTVLESLTRAKLQVQQALAHNRAQRDSLAFEAEANLLAQQKHETNRKASIAAKLRVVSRQIGEFVFEKNVDLPARLQTLWADIAENRVKLGTIAPLQRVGMTVVSERPVRPRPMRASLILVLAGGVAGVVAGLGWDYLATHRREIFRS